MRREAVLWAMFAPVFLGVGVDNAGGGPGLFIERQHIEFEGSIAIISENGICAGSVKVGFEGFGESALDIGISRRVSQGK